jgi:hypothetical protein
LAATDALPTLAVLVAPEQRRLVASAAVNANVEAALSQTRDVPEVHVAFVASCESPLSEHGRLSSRLAIELEVAASQHAESDGDVSDANG